MTEKIIGVYKITNTVTKDFYIGSSKNVKRRWAEHKCPSAWKKCPNNPMYIDMKKYGVDKFEFQMIDEVKSESLKEAEQKFIEMLKPTYNDRNANGLDIERYKEHKKEYYQQNRENKKKYDKEYYQQNRENKKKYYNQPCYYNSEMLTLAALVTRFRRAGIKNPTLEAKKYILTNYKDK